MMTLPKDRGHFINTTKTFLPTTQETPEAFENRAEMEVKSNISYYLLNSLTHYHVNILSYFVFLKNALLGLTGKLLFHVTPELHFIVPTSS